MRTTSGTGIGSHGSRIRSDHMTACVTRLRLAPPQNNATLAAVETASSHKGASSPILRLLAAFVTASEPKDSQIAIPTSTAVRMLRADTRRIAAAYANERVFAFATGWRTKAHRARQTEATGRMTYRVAAKPLSRFASQPSIVVK